MWPRATQILTGVVFFSTLGGACAVDTEFTGEEQARADAEAKLLECTGDQHCWNVCEERSRSVCIDGACAGCNLRQALLGDDDDSADDDSAAPGEVDNAADGNTAGGGRGDGNTTIGAVAGGADRFDCHGLDDGTECAWGAGYCHGGVCMGDACWGGELAWFDARTLAGDCLIWNGAAPGISTYRYLNGRLSNADCIVGIANELWWAGSAGAQGSLRIDGKAVPEEDTKLDDAAVNGDHILEWRGEDYEMQTRTPRDVRATEVTICYATELHPDDAE